MRNTLYLSTGNAADISTAWIYLQYGLAATASVTEVLANRVLPASARPGHCTQRKQNISLAFRYAY